MDVRRPRGVAVCHDQGVTLIEVMIASAIMIIGLLAFSTMLVNQQKDTKGLSEKLAALDLQQILLSALNDTVCTFILTDPSQSASASLPNRNKDTFDSTVPNDFISLHRIPMSASATAVPVAEVGKPASPITSSVVVQAITLTNFSGGSDQYTAEFQFKLSTSMRQLRPQFVKTTLVTTGPANAKQIVSCSVASSTKNGFCTPANAWDNSGLLTCLALPGYSEIKLSGVNSGGTAYRESGCCYIPNTPGSNGWCSPQYASWSGSFSGCGVGTANYSVVKIEGVVSGVYDETACCFIPTSPPAQNPLAFNSGVFAADALWSGCGGPFAQYNVIEQNTVTAGLGRNGSCTYVPK